MKTGRYSMSYKEIKEGLGTFLIPSSLSEDRIPRRSDEVFFNRIQEINRDFSVLAVRAYAKINKISNLSICEPLCGLGIRSARYALETPAKIIYSNDLNINAIEKAKKNIERLPPDFSKKIVLDNMECNYYLEHLNHKHLFFDFIDIDPFGSPIPFVYNSIELITNKGFLGFTATDLASLAGIYPLTLYAKYGVSYFENLIGNIHECSARTLITGIQHIGLIQNQSLIPILTLYHRHFIRTFFIRRRGINHVLKKTGYILFCKECKNKFKIPLEEKTQCCPFCKKSTAISLMGPLYLGLIQNQTYLDIMLQDSHLKSLGTQKKLIKLLVRMKNEATLDIPWSFNIPELAKKANSQVPSFQLIYKKLEDLGYKCVKTHFSGTTIKTNANETELLAILNPR